MKKAREIRRSLLCLPEKTKQTGFTLIELLVASVLALVLMLTMTVIIFQTIEFTEKQKLRLVLNEKAREIFDLLGNGGCCDNVNTPPRNLSGMRERKDFSEANIPSLRDDNRLRLDNPIVGTDFNIIGPETSPITIICRAKDDPIQDCLADNTRTDKGYLARDLRLLGPEIVDLNSSANRADRIPNDQQRNLTNRIVEVEFFLIQPHQANRTRFSSNEIRESYRTIFSYNKSQ